MREQKPKYIVPEHIKERVRNFMNEFMKVNELNKRKLVKDMEEKLGRSGCRTSLVKKFSKATFQLSEVIEILDIYGYELKIVPKGQIEVSENEH